MNRKNIIEYIAQEMGTTNLQAKLFVETFLEGIRKNIRKEGVKISGLGTFEAVKRKARKGRNPRTGEIIKIQPRWSPTFKPGLALKEAVQKRSFKHSK